MIFGDWLARSKAKPDDWYCQKASTPDYNKLATPGKGASPNEEEARETANERYHELCNQWRSAKAAEDATHVAWLQLWFGVFGLVGLGLTVYFAAQSARAASVAAQETARSVDVQIRMEGPLLHIQEFRILSETLTIHPFIKNSGNTPAVLVDASVNCSIGSNWVLPLVPQYGKPRPLGKRLLEKNNVHALYGSISADDDLDALLAGQAEAVVWGYVRYEDVFGRLRKRSFASAVIGFAERGDGSFDPLWNTEGGDAYNYDREELAFAP